MDNQVNLELGNELLFDDLLSPNLPHGTTCNEGFILDEMDSYFDDINSRLMISRMVSDSVIKGIVSAVTSEAAEITASKTEELDTLQKRLKEYEAVMEREFTPVKRSNTPSAFVGHVISCFPCCSDRSSDHSCREEMNKLKVEAEENLKRLKQGVHVVKSELFVDRMSTHPQEIFSENFNVINACTDALEGIISALYQKSDDACCLLKMLLSKQQWEHNLQKEITTTVVQNMISDAREKFGENCYKETDALNSFNTFSKNCQKAVESLASMRQMLEAFSTSLFNSEAGLAVLHHSFEILEESGELKKFHVQPKGFAGQQLPKTSFSEENSDASMDMTMESQLLKGMSEEELLSHFKTEMMKMKREHDLALQEKTEELFAVKRELLKEKGSSPLSFKREKEYELLKKNIFAFISILEHIVLENRKLWAGHNKQALLCCSKQRSNAMILENEQHHSPTTDKIDETSSASEQKYFSEENISEPNKKQVINMEDLNLEAKIESEMQKIVLTSFLDELQIKVEGLDLEWKALHETCITIYWQYVQNTVSGINPLIVKLSEEKKLTAALLQEKEKGLLLLMEENKKLKEEIKSLCTLKKEKDEQFLEAELMAIKQKKEHDALRFEHDMLKEQLKSHTHQYEMKLSEMNENLKITSNAFAEEEKLKNLFHDLLEEKNTEIALAVEKEKKHATFIKCMMGKTIESIEAISQFEGRTSIRLESNESRLKMVIYQSNELTKLANAVQKKASWYKQAFERRCSDLQKAEKEVDILGDEVETLLRLLEKIYIALEHYSPVLQHYPGVMEILKLIRQEIKRKINK